MLAFGIFQNGAVVFIGFAFPFAAPYNAAAGFPVGFEIGAKKVFFDHRGVGKALPNFSAGALNLISVVDVRFAIIQFSILMYCC